MKIQGEQFVIQGSRLFKQVGLGCLKLFKQVSCLTRSKLSEQVGKSEKSVTSKIGKKSWKSWNGVSWVTSIKFKIYRKLHNSFQKILSIKNDVRVDLGYKGKIGRYGY